MKQHAARRARAVLGRTDNPRTGVEVGVYRGDMSAELLRLAPGLTLYMVDNWASGRSRSYMDTRDPRAHDSAVEQVENRNAATTATAFASERRHILAADSVAAADEVPNASCDFVFIDAEHTYEAVTADISAWTPKVRPGGLLCGHDYCPPGKYTARGWPGVVRAVDEAVAENGWTLELGDRMTWFVEP